MLGGVQGTGYSLIFHVGFCFILGRSGEVTGLSGDGEVRAQVLHLPLVPSETFIHAEHPERINSEISRSWVRWVSLERSHQSSGWKVLRPLGGGEALQSPLAGSF